jgi:hypothetical protein
VNSPAYSLLFPLVWIVLKNYLNLLKKIFRQAFRGDTILEAYEMKNDKDNTKKEFREERAGFRQKLHQEIAEAKPAKIAAENESRRLKKRSQGQMQRFVHVLVTGKRKG